MTLPRRYREIAAQGGQTMVEFTIIVPVLLMLLFGVIQFGIVYNNYLTVTDAARVGARKAAVSRPSVDPEGLAEAAVRASASNLDQLKLDVEIDAPVWNQGADVTVTASYPYEVNLLGFVVASGEVSSSTTERIE